MKFPNPFAQLKALPKNQQAALGAGAAGAAGLGFYSYRKKKIAGGTTAKAPAANAVGSALTPAPDLSQYGQVAVLVPIDWQDGANFGGSGGLTGPLTPNTPPAAPPAAPPTSGHQTTTPAPALPPSSTTPPRSGVGVRVGGVLVPNLSGQVRRPVITPTSTTAYSFPQAVPLPTQPVTFYAPNLGGQHTIVPGAAGNTLGDNVIAAALANPYVAPSVKAQLAGGYGGRQAV